MARVDPQVVAEFLAQTSIFRSCPPEVLAKLAPHVEQQSYEAGKAMVPPGMQVNTLNFLRSGRASLQIVDVLSATRVSLEEVHPGDTFGEVGLVLGGASPVVVFAEDACEALLVQKSHFDKIAAVAPEVLHALAKRVAMRFVKVSMLGGKKTAASTIARQEPASVIPSALASSASMPASMPKGAIPFVEVAQYAPNPKLLELVSSRLILEHRVIPLELRGKTLVVGMVNPGSIAAREELRRALHSVDPEIVAISADDYSQSVVRMKIDVRDKAGSATMGRGLRPQYQAELKKEADKQHLVMGEEVVQLLDRILIEAVERRVSDVHIEAEPAGVRVRYRIHGMITDRKELIPASFAAPLVARVKVLAELDITERRLPQDGRIIAQIGNKEVNFRVSTLGAARGEKVVVRILDPGDVMRPLEQIFLDGRSCELVKRAAGSAHGAIVVAGATGSGKSSTLYSILNHRRSLRPDNNIVSAEDPIEYLIPGMTQSPVMTKIGLEYPVIVRAMMRQDPDVLMIGELRDAPTAEIVVEAALTGHLVVTSIHGSNVAAVLQRFIQFGAEPVRLGQALNIIVVQKLVRRLCGACVREDEIAPQLVEALIARKLLVKAGGMRFPRPGGCEACNMSGYLGRVPVVETFFLDDEARDALGTMKRDGGGTSMHDVFQKAEAAGNFLPFWQCARLLMARKALTPADALTATD